MVIWKANPTVVSAAIGAVLAIILTLPDMNLDVDTVGLIMAVVTAVLAVLTSAWTQRTALGLTLGVIQTAIPLALGIGWLELSVETTQAIYAAVPVLFGLFHWRATSPDPAPSLKLTA